MLEEHYYTLIQIEVKHMVTLYLEIGNLIFLEISDLSRTLANLIS